MELDLKVQTYGQFVAGNGVAQNMDPRNNTVPGNKNCRTIQPATCTIGDDKLVWIER